MFGKCYWVCMICNIFALVHSQIQCSRNCSTISVYRGVHTVYYSIQQNTCTNISIIDSELPTEPSGCKTYPLPKNWYLYDDPTDSKYQKIALNFTWNPCQNSKIVLLRGFIITLQSSSKVNVSNPVFEHINFCILHKLDFFKHIKATFYYDRFGYNDGLHLQPGQNLSVTVQSLPVPYFDTVLRQILINIPTCKNAQLANVFFCHQQRMFTLSYANHTCYNLMAVVNYNIPSYFGNTAILLFGIAGTSDVPPTVLQTWKDQPLQGDFIVTLPLNANLSINYSVTVFGNEKIDIHRVVHFSFEDCAVNNDERVKIAAISAAAVVMILFIVGVCFKCIQKHSRHLRETFVKKEFPLNGTRADVGHANRQSNGAVAKLEVINNKVKVYIIFFDDHTKHTEVVLKFVDYLIGDLAFDVVFCLYETEKICTDPVTWMMNSLENSDKVIIIWSPGATRRWYSSDKPNALNYDFFTPVLKKIFDDLFLQKNLLKYVFVYFNYVSKDDIPNEFIKSYSHLHFKLMQQLTDFYFRLIGQERYLRDGVIQENKANSETYFNENATGNKYGQVLHEKLNEMNKYVAKYPNWYNEKRVIKDIFYEKPNFAGINSSKTLISCQKENSLHTIENRISREVCSKLSSTPSKTSVLTAYTDSLHEYAEIPSEDKNDSALFSNKPDYLSPDAVNINQDVPLLLSSLSTAEPSSGECSFFISKFSTEMPHNLGENKMVEQTIDSTPSGSINSVCSSSKNDFFKDCYLPIEQSVEDECSHSQCATGYSSEASPINSSFFKLAPLKQDGDAMDFLVSINKENGML